MLYVLSNELLKKAFINGLKDKIRAKIRILRPTTLAQVMGMAKKKDGNLVLDQMSEARG